MMRMMMTLGDYDNDDADDDGDGGAIISTRR